MEEVSKEIIKYYLKLFVPILLLIGVLAITYKYTLRLSLINQIIYTVVGLLFYIIMNLLIDKSVEMSFPTVLDDWAKLTVEKVDVFTRLGILFAATIYVLITLVMPYNLIVIGIFVLAFVSSQYFRKKKKRGETVGD